MLLCAKTLFTSPVKAMSNSDDVSGRQLSTQRVEEARREELAVFKAHQVCEKNPIQRCLDETGKQPIGIKWNDTNKGDEERQDYRSRLVAKEIKRSNLDEMFAATPPLEAQKMLMSLAMPQNKRRGPPLKLLFIDVKRADVHADARRPVFIRLPDEDDEPGMCGRPLKSLYGTRDAASNWEETHTPRPSSRMAGCKACRLPVLSHPCGARLVVHGDDFTFLGSDTMLDLSQKVMQQKFEIKIRVRMGPDKDDDKSIRMLNRCLSWGGRALFYESDPRHADIIVQALGMKVGEKRNVTTPGSKIEEMPDDVPLGPGKAHQYRSLVARANFLALDRADVCFAVKERCRFMQSLTGRSWSALVKLAKYLK